MYVLRLYSVVINLSIVYLYWSLSICLHLELLVAPTFQLGPETVLLSQRSEWIDGNLTLSRLFLGVGHVQQMNVRSALLGDMKMDATAAIIASHRQENANQ